MDELREILGNFGQDEIRSFKSFCQRKKLKKNRKDLILLDFLINKPNAKKEEFILKHYEEVNYKSKEAYFTLRKKLYTHLQDFILTKERKEDVTGTAETMGHISLAQYLFKQNIPELGWKYLHKAEHSAQKNYDYKLLKTIYLIQIEFAHFDASINIQNVLAKKIKNDDRIATQENFIIAQSIIKNSLYKFKMDGKPIDINDLVSKTLKKYKIKEELLQSPKLTYLLLDIIRNASIATKQYHSFLPVVETHFRNLFEGFGFDTSEQLYKVRILYMYVHTLYRNLQFGKALNILTAYNDELNSISKKHYYELYPKFKLLYASCLNANGNNEGAIKVLEKEVELGLKNWSTENKYHLYINHIVNTYQSGDLNVTALLFEKYFDHSDNFVQKHLSKEWTLKKNMLEVLLEYDMENYAEADSKIKSIERRFKDLYTSDNVYEKVKPFLKLIKTLINEPYLAKEKAFEEKIEESWDWKPIEQEDIQQIQFYAWLKSKMTKQTQYETFQELIKAK